MTETIQNIVKGKIHPIAGFKTGNKYYRKREKCKPKSKID